MRWARVTLVILLAVAALAAGLGLVAVSTERGTRWLLELADRHSDAVQVQRVRGTLAGTLRLDAVAIEWTEGHLQLAAAELELDLAGLWRGVLHVERARLDGVELTLAERAGDAAAPGPGSGTDLLRPPIELVIERALLADAVVHRPDGAELRIARVQLAGRWLEDRIGIDALELRGPDGFIELAGQWIHGAVYDLEARGRFAWTLGERRYAGELEIDTSGHRSQGVLTLHQPFEAALDASWVPSDRPAWQLALEVPAFDPRAEILRGGSITKLSARLVGRGTLTQGVFSGSLAVNGEALELKRLELARTPEAIHMDSLIARVGDGAGVLRGTGKVDLSPDPWRAALDLRWDELEIPAEWIDRTLLTRGQAALELSPRVFSASGALALGPPGRVADVEFELGGTAERVEIHRLAIEQPSGSLRARGVVERAPALRWDVRIGARSFDPGDLFPDWPGDLNAQLRTEGALREAGAHAELDVVELSGTLRRSPVSGSGRVTLQPDRRLGGRLALRWGGTELSVRARPAEAIDAVVGVHVEDLGRWTERADGAVDGRFRVRGTWPALRVTGSARARGLRVLEWRARRADATLDVANPRQPRGSVELRAGGVRGSGLRLESLRIDVRGDAAAHDASLSADGQALDARAELRGSWKPADAGGRWSGTLEGLELALDGDLDLALTEPAPITLDAAGELSVARSCLAGEEVRVCISAEREAQGALSASYRLQAVPLELLTRLAPAYLDAQLRGIVAGAGDIRRTADGAWLGNARIESPEAHLLLREGAPAENVLLYQDLDAELRLAGTTATLQLAAELAEDGRIEATLTARSLGSSPGPITGAIDARLPNLGPFARFVPSVADLRGSATLQAAVSGTLADPALRGELRARDLGAAIPALGIQLRDASVRAESQPDGTFLVEARAASSGGGIEVGGTASLDGALSLRIEGADFLAFDRPSGRVEISPDLSLTREGGALRLTGRVHVPRATVDLAKLPQANAARRISPDVVVVDRPPRPEPERPVPALDARVVVTLGDDVQVHGFGLEVEADGRITVVERPGQPTAAYGEIQLDGRFERYGQELRIDDGRILYVGGALDNPQLQLDAVREIDEGTVGLHIRGSARAPQLQVFSSATMGQADALSYLVTGKPLAALRSDGAESDALRSAARSLGTAAGSLLLERIGTRLGLDELGIESSEILEGDAFTVGKYLSPRLYLSYGLGLFEPGSVLSLRYRISDSVSVRVLQAPEETRAGIELRVER